MFGPRMLYWFYRVFLALRQRVPRRLTRPGMAVALGCAVSSLTGFDTINTVAYQSFALLFCVFLVSGFFVFFFRGRFSAQRLLPRFGTAGIPFTYLVSIVNHTRKTQHDLTLRENCLDLKPAYHEWWGAWQGYRKWLLSFNPRKSAPANPFRLAAVQPATLPPVPPRRRAEARVEIVPLRRGVLRFTGLTLGRPDPLGLIWSLVRVPAVDTVLILPKRYHLPQIAMPGTTKYQPGGVAFASHVGQSEEFVALRDYRRGDPMRHIHWRSWAKAGKPIVKEFEDEFFVRHALVLDTFVDDPRSELFEEAVSVAASFACAIPTQESLLDLLFVGPEAYCFTAGRQLAQTDQILEILASVRAAVNKPFEVLEKLVLDHAALLSGCICVLLAWDEPRRQLVRTLQGLNVPVVVVVLTAAGAEPLESGLVGNVPGRFHVLELGRIQEGLARL